MFERMARADRARPARAAILFADLQASTDALAAAPAASST